MAGHDWLQTPSQHLFSKAKAQGVLTPALKGPFSHEKYPKRYDATLKVKCYLEQSLTPALKRALGGPRFFRELALAPRVGLAKKE